MKSKVVLLPLLLLAACNLRPEEDRIRIPNVTKAFYENAVSRLENELDDDPLNQALVELQLSYFEKLEWPAEAANCVERSKAVLDLDPVVARKYADFYVRNGKHDALLQLRDELGERYETPDWMWQYQILSSNRLGLHEEAKDQLRTYLARAEGQEANFFGGREYLLAGDSLLSFYHLQKVKDAYANERDFVELYVPLAFHVGSYQEVLSAIDAYDAKALDITLKYKALSLYATGQPAEAKQLLWSIPGRENLMTLSGWYADEKRWDSAYLSLDKILLAAPDDLVAMMAKGKLDDRRGWFSRAAQTFTRVLDIDSTQTEARDMLDLVTRKIAYLRRIRETSQAIPTIELDSKKGKQ